VSTPLVPPVRLTDPNFSYTSSVDTDVSKRFARDPKYAAFLAKREKQRREAAAISTTTGAKQ
jgi:hypothetical protein